MNGFFLFLLESSILVFFTSLLVLLYDLRRAPEGFQHYNLFHYGTPPTGLIPVESPTEPAPAAVSSWR